MLIHGKAIVLILGALLYASPALGEEVLSGAPASPAASSPVSAATSTWSGEAEAGGVATTGNTETRSINTKLTLKHSGERWDERLSADYLEASDRNQTTAERTTATFESRYRLDVRDYLFGVVRYDADRFSGYAQQLSETAGYGRRFLFSPSTTLETEAGAGSRQVRLTDNTNKGDAILRLAAKFIHKFSKASEFKESVFSELASDNRHTESTTSLRSRINGNLSMKAAFTVTDNSRTPEGVKKTDTITSITLVLDFGT
jgi:putative salt-induced outer membrane protein